MAISQVSQVCIPTLGQKISHNPISAMYVYLWLILRIHHLALTFSLMVSPTLPPTFQLGWSHYDPTKLICFLGAWLSQPAVHQILTGNECFACFETMILAMTRAARSLWPATWSLCFYPLPVGQYSLIESENSPMGHVIQCHHHYNTSWQLCSPSTGMRWISQSSPLC